MDCEADLIVLRGGGDLATGVAQKLWRAGFRLLVLELGEPLAIRRTVALSTAMNAGLHRVEDMTGRRVLTPDDCAGAWSRGEIPLLEDPEMDILKTVKPAALVEATLAKRNLGLRAGLAPIVIALGPGFTAPRDADAVIETMRGHDLGRLITEGSALPNSGVPGELGGKTAERVVHAPLAGKIRLQRRIGDLVRQGETLFFIGETPVPSPLSGLLRGLAADGLVVPQRFKCADIDPRLPEEVQYMHISDKARALGGAVLEACFYLARRKGIVLRPGRAVPPPAGSLPGRVCA